MVKLTANLNDEGKYSRYLLGAILIIGSILGFGKVFLFLVGIILIVEGVLGWGVTPHLMEKFLKKSNNTPK